MRKGKGRGGGGAARRAALLTLPAASLLVLVLLLREDSGRRRHDGLQCKAWRATLGCSGASGPRVLGHDQPCSAKARPVTRRSLLIP
jgi:hypothetical protein